MKTPCVAIGIFSGGLDSLLAVRLLLDQGLTPTLVTFTSPFFPPEKAREGAKQLGLPLVEMDIYDELLPLIKNPPHGLGRNLNPCIDCHALMFQKAGKLLIESGRDGFLFSGEVVGQRPMSQNPRALKVVAEDSGHCELILRPLSAKILGATLAEEKGWIDRQGLLGLSGRGRRAQLDLARQYGYKAPPPAGGCLLTDPAYSNRLKWLLSESQGHTAAPWPPVRLAELIKRGRLFAGEDGQWLVVGRNQADNHTLATLAEPGDYLLHLEGRPGPTVLVPRLSHEPGSFVLEMARGLAAAYGDHGGEMGQEALVRQQLVKGGEEVLPTELRPSTDWEKYLLKGQVATNK